MSGETILIVEDERSVARGLEYGLRHEGYEVLWAETGRAALELVRAHDPHLILLDVRLPDLSGFDVCRRLRSSGAKLPILMVTARDEAVDKVLGLELGADDYVVKPFDFRELAARIRSQLRRAYGDLALDVETDRLAFGALEIDPDRMRVAVGGTPIELTPTEYRLLRHLVDNAGRPVSRTELIEAVWGYASDVGSERTIDVHIRHLRQKLETDPSQPRWISTVRGVGYRFELSD